MGTKKMRIKIIKFLKENGPQATNIIMDHINDTTRMGTTPNELGNVLARDKRLVKIGRSVKAGVLSGQYEVCVWGLAENC
jgi:hypothetical protein